MKLTFAVLLIAVGVVHSRFLPTFRGEACCADLGCFANTGNFFSLLNRPISLLPECNLVSDLRLHLNSKEVLQPLTEILDPYQLQTIASSHFDVNRETKILIHGFTDHFDWPWWKDMINVLMGEGDFNIIRVDWSKGNSFPYTKGTANTRLVGAYVAKFINLLKSHLNYNPSKIHIIGHSLGAHIAGYAGERVDKIARISGIDPAGPYFTNMDVSVRLDPSDATVVDTLIADGESLLSLGFGSPQAMGHLNFYINGGVSQPGCSSFLTLGALISGPSSFNTSSYDWSASGVQTFYHTVGCNHWRALSVYIETISKTRCALKAFQCDTYENYLHAKCLSCANGACSNIGYIADTSLAVAKVSKNFYAQTTDRPSFCQYAYKLSIKLQSKAANSNSKEEEGTIYATFYGEHQTSQRIQVTPSAIKLSPGATLDFLVQQSQSLGPIRSIVLYWEASFSLLDIFRTRKIYIDGNIALQDQEETVKQFRGSKTELPEKQDWSAF